MKLDSFIKEELNRFNIKLNKEIFSKEAFLIKKAKSEVKLSSVCLINKKVDKINGKYIKVEYIQDILKENPKILKEAIIYKDVLMEHELKYILHIKPKAVIFRNLEFINPVHFFPVPLFKLHEEEIPGNIDIQLSLKKREINGTNFFFDIGYGTDIFYIVFPYDSLKQNERNLSFRGSFEVLKEITRRLLNITKPKGFRIRILICDHRFHFNYGLKKHLENINMSRVLSVLNLQDCGLGNEKIVVKNNRYMLDNTTESLIYRELYRMGIYMDRINLFEFSDIDTVFKDKPIVWLLSYPVNKKHNIDYTFLKREYSGKVSAFIFSILKNAF